MRNDEVMYDEKKEYDDGVGKYEWVVRDLISKRFMPKISTAVSYEDMFQIGMIGVLKGIRDFDESKGAKIETYLYTKVWSEIGRLVSESSTMGIHIPGYIKIEAVKLINDDKLNENSPASKKNTHYAAECLQFKKVKHDGYSNLVVSTPSCEDRVAKDDILMRGFRTLSAREKTVIELRFFSDLKLLDIGKRIGVSKERARQIMNESLAKMKRGIDGGVARCTI